VSLFAIQFASPRKSRADSYSIVGSWAENTWGFDGINASGDVYLQSFYAVHDYQTEILSRTGASEVISSNLPLTFVSDRGTYCSQTLAGFAQTVRGLCNNGRFTFLYSADGGPDTSLYLYSGAGSAQFVLSAPSGGILAMDSLGDIVFENGFWDQAYYAVNVTTQVTPEPSNILLFATGSLALCVIFRRRIFV